MILLPLIVIVFAAGIVVVCRPATTGVASVISAIMGVQVAGIAVVASRDGWNFAGDDGASYERGFVSSPLAATMAMVAGAAVGMALYWCSLGRRQALVVRTGTVVAGVAVAGVVPTLLRKVSGSTRVDGRGPVRPVVIAALGIGLVAARTLRTAAARAVLLCGVSWPRWSLLSSASRAPLGVGSGCAFRTDPAPHQRPRRVLYPAWQMLARWITVRPDEHIDGAALPVATTV